MLEVFYIRGRGAKDKGSKFERELAEWFNSNVYGNDRCFRAPLSGGGNGANFRMTGGADLVGTPFLHIEAKRVERLNFLDAMKQAETSIDRLNAPEMAVVINRRNRMATDESLVCLRLADFACLYRAYLREQGELK